MTRLVQAFLSGIFFTFIYDFFIFLGIFENYIKKYDIDVYYNILFADHQNIFLFFTIVFIVGYLTTYIQNVKITASILALLFLISVSTLLPFIGESLGQSILMQKNINLHVGSYTYSGDLFYKGREKLYFYDKEFQKMITFTKEEVNDEAYK